MKKVPVPELKQRPDLSLADFERQPVWVSVHNMDFGKPWYDACDEDTVRPWSEPLPASTKRGMVFVAATFVLRDGSAYPGYVRVVGEDWDAPPPPRKMLDGGTVQHRSFRARCGGSPLAVLGLQQPRIFVNQQRFSFWGGRRGIPAERRQAFYAAIGKSPEAIFPLRFTADPKFATGILRGQLDGFYRMGDAGQPPQVEL